MATIALPRIAVLDDIERYFADVQPAALSQHVAAASVTQQQQQQRMALARDALAQLKSAVVGQLRSHCGAAATAVEPVDAALAARIMAGTEELGDKSKRLAALRVQWRGKLPEQVAQQLKRRRDALGASESDALESGAAPAQKRRRGKPTDGAPDGDVGAKLDGSIQVLRDTADDIAAGVRAQAPRLATALRDASDAADVVSRFGKGGVALDRVVAMSGDSRPLPGGRRLPRGL